MRTLDPQLPRTRRGKPLPLALEETARHSPRSCATAAAATCSFSTLLRELRAAGAIHELPDGRWEPLTRNYLPHTIDENVIRLWGTGMADVATTYVHNLTRTAKMPPRFEARGGERPDPEKRAARVPQAPSTRRARRFLETARCLAHRARSARRHTRRRSQSASASACTTSRTETDYTRLSHVSSTDPTRERQCPPDRRGRRLARCLRCGSGRRGFRGRARRLLSGVTSVGPISGFGSVIQGGIEYQTTGAQIQIEDQPATEAQLQVGQVRDDQGHRGIRMARPASPRL